MLIRAECKEQQTADHNNIWVQGKHKNSHWFTDYCNNSCSQSHLPTTALTTTSEYLEKKKNTSGLSQGAQFMMEEAGRLKRTDK